MVEKIATESGRHLSKQRPQVKNNDMVRNEVVNTESGNAGNYPISNVNLTINNNAGNFSMAWF